MLIYTMGITEICNSITNTFKAKRPPFPQLNRLMMVCSMVKRPGLSVIQSTSNIVKDLDKLGIPTEPMPDGSPNLTVSFVYTVVKEIYRALRIDAMVQAGVKPHDVLFRGFGGNAGGPIVVEGFNTNAGNIIVGRIF